MKITAQQLRKIIREEIEKLGEAYTPWTPQTFADYVSQNVESKARDYELILPVDLNGQLKNLKDKSPESVKSLLSANGLGNIGEILYTSWLDTPSGKLSRR